ncbi:490_t:CDS:2 [Ambispora leptoticha]|uniref:490_t:CDS:1 n=1 Tax=Ambispora leptoticha TaxID=144679 RepID=A0A9N8WCY3_9GLOM|nr:490_t:CDS:2 [Ambispora leptoticha]
MELLQKLEKFIHWSVDTPGRKYETLLESVEKYLDTLPITSQNVFEMLVGTMNDDEESEYISMIGFFLENGIGTDKQLEKAFKYYQRGAERKDVFAQMKLGDCYVRGTGIAMNLDLAAFWYEQSIKNGDLGIKRKQNLAYYYQNTRPNPIKAFYWNHSAAKVGHEHSLISTPHCFHHANSIVITARCYLRGIGTKKDVHEAFMWYRKGGLIEWMLADFGLETTRIWSCSGRAGV